jgi:hypothetical protein
MWAGARSYTARNRRQSTLAFSETQAVQFASAFSVFLLLLAVDAIPSVWQRVQALERDFLVAVHTSAKRFGMPVQAA